jgi:hypothetical protein
MSPTPACGFTDFFHGKETYFTFPKTNHNPNPEYIIAKWHSTPPIAMAANHTTQRNPIAKIPQLLNKRQGDSHRPHDSFFYILSHSPTHHLKDFVQIILR